MIAAWVTDPIARARLTAAARERRPRRTPSVGILWCATGDALYAAIADDSTRKILTDVPLLERARLKPPEITKYFFEQARKEGKVPDWLPLSVEEALKQA